MLDSSPAPPPRPRRGSRLARVLRALATLGVAGFAALVACNAFVLWDGSRAIRDSGALAPADAILVLGAGVRASGQVSSVLGDRLDTALDVFERGAAPRFLLSGDHENPRYDEVGAMRRYLEARGVAPEILFLDHAGIDTYSSMVRARDVFGVRRVVVVTQRFHLPRALFVARHLGIEAEGVAADRRSYGRLPPFELREILSRAKACVDVLDRRRPKYEGPPMPIGGDGRATH